VILRLRRSAGSSASSNVTALAGLLSREPRRIALLDLFQGAEAGLTGAALQARLCTM
jgi:hypothetical protein